MGSETTPPTGLRAIAGAAALVVCLAAATGAAGEGPQRVYAHRLEPREHPDYGRRAVRPPDWETFENRTRFIGLRRFAIQDGRIVDIAGALEAFTRTHDLGDVVWPSYPVLFADNLGDLADEIRRRGLYLFGIWGYVPGSGPGGYWRQFRPPAAALARLEATLGERWLGTDIGEQDGRYVAGYANQMTPASADRFGQYLNFQRHFERMGDDLGHRHAALVALTFGHYLLREGTYTLIGSETAQAHPNSQVSYAFIRGAGKQHGVPWFGNVSIFNRWGHKSYEAEQGGDGAHGPTHGTSLSLMKRLLYTQILSNCVAVGFESAWFEGEALSPIGRMQQAARRWVREHGQPGTMHAPVALVLDALCGWTVPRHVNSGSVYRVWGNLPYGPGDHLTDAVLDLLYPGYQDASYFRDESGFMAPTPFGDIADCLLSDAPPWVLDRYPVAIVAGEVRGGRELRDALQAYAERGGHVVITAANLARLPGGLAGRTEAVDATVACGRGRVTFFASPFGIVRRAALDGPLRGDIDAPLPKPYALEPGVRGRLEEILRDHRLFHVRGEGLSVVTCRKGVGDYTLGVMNNTWRPQPFGIESRCGAIESVRELPLDRSEREAVGLAPPGIDPTGLGAGDDGTIAGGDLRIFAVRVREAGVEEIPHVAPPPRPRDRFLTLRRARSIQEEILARPTFFRHFDGVCVDWRVLHDRERAVLEREARWLARQGVRVIVDMSSGVNLYPALRLLDNVPEDYAASMAAWSDVLFKMEIVGAKDLVLTLHRDPEGNFTGEQSNVGFVATLKKLAAEAGARGVTLHLRLGPGKPPRNFAEGFHWLEPANEPNLKLAVETAVVADAHPADARPGWLEGRMGLWLVAARRSDPAGETWDTHAPLHAAADLGTTAAWLATAPAVPQVLDALLADQDEEYLDAVALEKLNATPP